MMIVETIVTVDLDLGESNTVLNLIIRVRLFLVFIFGVLPLF